MEGLHKQDPQTQKDQLIIALLQLASGLTFMASLFPPL